MKKLLRRFKEKLFIYLLLLLFVCFFLVLKQEEKN